MPTTTADSVVDALAELHRWNLTWRQERMDRMREAAASGASAEQIAKVLGEPLALVRNVIGPQASDSVTVSATLWA
jgi:hypothetical protein